MLKKLFYGVALLAAINLMSGCSGCNGKSNSESLEVPDSLVTDAPLQLSEEVINDVIQNISSPVEMANLIKMTGVGFSQKILNSTDNSKKYDTSFKRALNLGVYSADLGYINTFNKNTIVVSYLLSVKELAEGIKVGQFLDFNTLKRMATNNTNLDSLKELSVSSFNKMDSYLRDQKRSNVSTAIVTGAWIEGMYITCNVIEQSNNPELINRLGEQKDIVNILLIILNNFGKADPNFGALVKEMEGIQEAYKEVRITTEFGEPKRIEKDGTLIIVQDEISQVHITPEQVKTIIGQIKKVREFIVS